MSSVFTVAKGKSHATKWCNDVSVVLIVSEIYCRQYQKFRMLTYSTEQVRRFTRTVVRVNNKNNKNKEISRSGLVFRSNISETVRDIRVPFSVWPRARVTLPNGANDVSVVLIVSEIYCRQYQALRMLTCTSVVNRRSRSRTIVRERLNNKKNKEISRSGLWLPVEYLRNGKRYSSSVFTVAEV